MCRRRCTGKRWDTAGACHEKSATVQHCSLPFCTQKKQVTRSLCPGNLLKVIDAGLLLYHQFSIVYFFATGRQNCYRVNTGSKRWKLYPVIVLIGGYPMR